MKVRLFTEDFGALLDLKKQLAAQDASISVLEVSSTNLKNYLTSRNRSCGASRVELHLARAAIGGENAFF